MEAAGHGREEAQTTESYEYQEYWERCHTTYTDTVDECVVAKEQCGSGMAWSTW